MPTAGQLLSYTQPQPFPPSMMMICVLGRVDGRSHYAPMTSPLPSKQPLNYIPVEKLISQRPPPLPCVLSCPPHFISAFPLGPWPLATPSPHLEPHLWPLVGRDATEHHEGPPALVYGLQVAHGSAADQRRRRPAHRAAVVRRALHVPGRTQGGGGAHGEWTAVRYRTLRSLRRQG